MEFGDIESDLGCAGEVRESGYLSDHFLVAMPGIGDPRFSRALIRLVRHTDQGALGFMVNQPAGIATNEILTRAGISDDSAFDIMTEDEDPTAALDVVKGGPVEDSRGFVLHTTDYAAESTSRIADGLALTTTLDVLRAVARGRGPRRALLALGYCGWRPGQLDDELRDNAWLTIDADAALIFDVPVGERYDAALGTLGIAAESLSGIAGNA